MAHACGVASPSASRRGTESAATCGDRSSAFEARRGDHANVALAPCVFAGLLLDRGASINVTTNNNYTPLFTAALWDHESVVRLLLDRGADTTIESVRDWQARRTAAQVAPQPSLRQMIEDYGSIRRLQPGLAKERELERNSNHN